MEKAKDLSHIVKEIPFEPGVYLFYSAEGKVIYVGKAKSLRKRVSSYFVKKQVSSKVQVLVSKITDIKYFTVKTEEDALLLENNLIKNYRPRYNVLLKDDKSYPWICVKNEDFPRVFMTRNVVKDGSLYFGPYTSIRFVRFFLDTIKELYKIRTCKYVLSDKNIENGKYKVCLEYHLGNCNGICEGKEDKDEYDKNIDEIKHLLKGGISDFMSFLKEKEKEFVSKLEFEKAHKVDTILNGLRNYQANSPVLSSKISNIDVFSIKEFDKYFVINYIKVYKGAIISIHNAEVKKVLDESKEDVLEYSIIDIRSRFKSYSSEIIVPFEIEIPISNIKIVVPQKGDKKKLLELSFANLRSFHNTKSKLKEEHKKKSVSEFILNQAKADFRLKELPVHIECFDNSNIQGTNPVASCVVFKNAKPSKKDYRHFNIKTVVGPDDFASMHEVMTRRYTSLMEKKKSLPQLIVIDGGKGQLSYAVKSLKELGLYGKIAIISIAKKLEEIYFPGDPVPLYIDKNSSSLKLVQNLRDEAHRFAITFHRLKRSGDFVKSELNSIKGIGKQTSDSLLSTFGSVNVIKEKSIDEIAVVVGFSKAKLIYDYFHG